MSEHRRKPTAGRADRVVPGIWRIRLPLPWPGVPHVNAWAIESADAGKITLVDTGINAEGAFEELERTLHLAGHAIEDVELLVSTHAPSDHSGPPAPPPAAPGSAPPPPPNPAHPPPSPPPPPPPPPPPHP